MTTISNLPFKRFVMQVSTGAPQIKSNWQAMMADNLEKLKSPVWREVTTNESSLVDHDFTKASHLDDSYDAYKMTGNYDSTAMTEVAYAGMVAYRYRLPDDYMSGSANITSISVPVYRDRFCKGGIHVAALFGGNIPTNFTWDNVRGTRGTAIPPKVAMMAQSDEAAPYLTASSAADDVATFAVNPVVNKSRYLWIILTIEDYEDGWEWYNKKEKRLYAIEGSARLAGDMLSVEFDAEVTPDGSENMFSVVRGGVLPRLPEGSASGARVLELQRDGTPLVPYELSNDEPTQYKIYLGDVFVGTIDGTVTACNYSGIVDGKMYVAICGNFQATTFGVRGLLVYEVFSRQRIDGTPASNTIDPEIFDAFRSKSVRLNVLADVNGSVVVGCFYTTSNRYRVSSNLLTITTSGVSVASIGAFQDWNLYEVVPLASGNFVRNRALFVNSSSPCYVYVSRNNPVPGGVWIGSSIYRPQGAGNGILVYGRVDSASFAPSSGDFGGTIILTGNISGYTIRRNEQDVSFGFSQSARILWFDINYTQRSSSSSQLETEFVVTNNSIHYSNFAPDGISVMRVYKGAAESGVFAILGKAIGPDGWGYQNGVRVDAELVSNRKALPYEAMPFLAFASSLDEESSNSFAVVPVPGHAVHAEPTPYYMSNEIANPSATGSAIGLRTLQARFYLGQTESVVRASRARLGAAFSVRAGTATLNVATDGVITPTAVPVWRLFSSALVIPFAVPTTWRGKSVRLDWRGWTGTATAGSVFNVWLKAGEYIEDCPAVLATDVPYDALAAQASGWQLLGTIDATLTGDSRVSTLAAPQLAGKKCATLMLTAFASADGINPDDNTTWPIGAGTEVDCEVTTAEIANTAKAWFPSIFLLS